jgi:cytochrome c-type biogenesis protein CcmH
VTEKEPKNSDAWYSLGQALVGIGEFEDALTSFDKVIGIDGEQADLFGAKAQASYYKNEQKITEEVQSYIDKALSLDAKDPSTNILLGMNNFINKNYQQAIDYWQIIVNDNRPSVNIDALKGAIVEAQSRLSLTGGKVNDDIRDAGPQLSLHVSVSEGILTQLNTGEDKVVFIYAIPNEGARMPLAAIKVKASDLPLDVILNDQSAMTPAAKLSDVEQVSVYAIISKDGGVGIKPGDFKAEIIGVNVDTKETIGLVINSLVE